MESAKKVGAFRGAKSIVLMICHGFSKEDAMKINEFEFELNNKQTCLEKLHYWIDEDRSEACHRIINIKNARKINELLKGELLKAVIDVGEI